MNPSNSNLKLTNTKSKTVIFDDPAINPWEQQGNSDRNVILNLQTEDKKESPDGQAPKRVQIADQVGDRNQDNNAMRKSMTMQQLLLQKKGTTVNSSAFDQDQS